jgi:thioredoxin-related protein
VIVAVNLDWETEKAQEFLQDYPADFTVVFNPSADLAREYDIDSMPNSFVFGRDGALLLQHRGFRKRDTDEYEAAIVIALQAGTSNGKE